MADDLATEKRAAIFEAMAARIRLNKDSTFGGAFVIIPPESEEPVQLLTLSQEQPGLFWAAIQTLAQQAVNILEEQQRRQGFR